MYSRCTELDIPVCLVRERVMLVNVPYSRLFNLFLVAVNKNLSPTLCWNPCRGTSKNSSGFALFHRSFLIARPMPFRLTSISTSRASTKSIPSQYRGKPLGRVQSICRGFPRSLDLVLITLRIEIRVFRS